MNWLDYKKKLINSAKGKIANQSTLDYYISYAENLYKKQLPIIYDQKNLALLLGIDNEYLHRMSNEPKYFYRTFYIEKKMGKKRRIDEPLPDLKKVQVWILKNILYAVSCEVYAKAYIPGLSIKDNVRFHRMQKIVLKLDIKNFFPSIKSGKVLNVFLGMGYSVAVAVFLTKLCCLNECLPQGAPTSAYLSNLIMNNFDGIIGKYCLDKKLRYTRYADDLTISGDVNIGEIIYLVDRELRYLDLKRNIKKMSVMRRGNRQKVTGIIVNDKLQLDREYRLKIRQELYYIKKYGIDSHLSHIGEERGNYISHLLGKISYCLFINPKDEKMKEYLIDASKYKKQTT